MLLKIYLNKYIFEHFKDMFVRYLSVIYVVLMVFVAKYFSHSYVIDWLNLQHMLFVKLQRNKVRALLIYLKGSFHQCKTQQIPEKSDLNTYAVVLLRNVCFPPSNFVVSKKSFPVLNIEGVGENSSDKT